MPTVRALIVDDFEPFRRFVCSTLGSIPHLQIIGEASDGLEGVNKAKELTPDLIVLDIGLPTLNGLEASHRISGIIPDTKILFVTQNDNADLVQAALSNGAQGFVLKTDAGSELLPAIEAVLRGEKFVSSGTRRDVLDKARTQNSFSPRLR